jgi:hypothetical protein
VPEDVRNFSAEAMEKLKKASRHIGYLINEGYDLKQASTFVGNHFLLSERQRLAVVRSLATIEQLDRRGKKQWMRYESNWEEKVFGRMNRKDRFGYENISNIFQRIREHCGGGEGTGTGHRCGSV